MKTSEKIIKYISRWRNPHMIFVIFQLLWMAAMLGIVVIMVRRSWISFSYDRMLQTFLLHLPALAYLLFLWYRYTRDKVKIVSNMAFFSTFVVPCISMYLAMITLIIHPFMTKYISDSENIKTLIGVCIVTNLLPCLAFGAFYLYIRGTQMKVRLAIAERERTSFMLQMLKNQMNPHFLFNALNVAASLPYEDPERASQFIKRLGAGYRYLLQVSDKKKVPLSMEMEFVRNYIYMEEVRFEKKLNVEIDIPESFFDRQIIPASVQLLVQNALKHNTNTAENPLNITIKCDRMGVFVSNNIQLRNTEETSGRGLRNLRMQYGHFGKHITVTNDGTCFTVHLPFL